MSEEALIAILVNLVFLAVGYLVGWKFREFMAIKHINEHFEAERTSRLKNAEKNTIDITIEKDGDKIFVYNKETKEYMAHAENRYFLEKTLMEKELDSFR